MKKFFSAILLMTMMVFSVGTFVSCNDLVNEIEGVKGQATELEAAVDALEAEIATLETKLQAAQSAADDAMAAAKAAQKTGDEAKVLAEAAKAAAADAEAKAIAKAKEEVAALKTELEAAIDKKADKTYVDELVKAANDAITKLQGDVKTLEEKLATYEDTLKTFKENLEKLGALTEELEERIDYNLQAITNLQGAVDNHEMRIEDLEAAVAKIEKAMKEMDNNLIKAIAGQIQSIVYVPETTAGTIAAKGFDYSASLAATATAAQKAAAKTVVFSATYEVMPKELASTITVDNASLVTVATKAAAAVECTVVSVVADDATGRVVVNARIAAGSDAYKSLNGTGGAAVALRVSQANPVEVDENTTEDLGTYVSSAYTNVTVAKDNSGAVIFDDVYDNFVFVDKDNKLIGETGKAFDNSVTKDAQGQTVSAPGYKVAYNYVGLDKANVNLFPFTVAFEILDGVYVTPEVATTLIGTDLAVTYSGKYADGRTAVAPKHYLKDGTAFPEKVNNVAVTKPILVTGNDLNATATLQVSNVDTYKGVGSIGVYADLELGVFKANGQPLDLTAKARYTIDEGTAVNNSVVIDEVNHTWTYGQGKTATTLAPVAELAVALPDALTDVQPLFYEAGTKTKEAKTFSVTWGPNNAKKTANATVKALSKKAVEITGWSGAKLDFGTDAKTYTFSAELQDPDSKITYPVSFDVNLSAMPDAKTITLAPITLATGSKMVENVVVLDEIIKHIAAKDPNYKWSVLGATHTEAGTQKSATLNDKPNADVVTLTLATKAGSTPNSIVENSTVSVDYAELEKYENNIAFTEEFVYCGVTFTVKGTVTTTKPTLSITTNEGWVSPEGIVNLEGTIALPYAVNTKTNIETGKSTAYALNMIDLRKYVYLSFPEDLVESDYMLRYRLLTDLEYKDKTYAEAPTFLAYAPVDAKRTGAGLNELTWNNDLSELEFEVTLVSNKNASADDKKQDGSINYDNDITFGEPVTFKLVIPQLVTLNTDKVVKAKYSTNSDATANIVSGIAITDVFADTVDPYNPYASELGDLFDGFSAEVKAGKVQTPVKSKNDEFFDIYDMDIEAGKKEDIKVYYNDAPVALEYFEFGYYQNTGKIIFSGDNGALRGDVRFDVPVTLTYKYDNYGIDKQTKYVSVVFSTNATDEDATSITTPAGYQWAATVNYREEYALDENGKKVQAVDEDGNPLWELNPDGTIAQITVYERDENGKMVMVKKNKPVYVMEYPESSVVIDLGLSTDGFTFAVEMEEEGEIVYKAESWTFPYAEVVAANETSGEIILYDYLIDYTSGDYLKDADGNNVKEEITRVPYSDFTGTAVKIDLGELFFYDYKTENSIINCTLVGNPVEIQSGINPF